MTNRCCYSLIIRGAALGALFAIVQAAYAAPVILTATVNTTAQTIAITGQSLLPVSGLPVVTVAGVSLAIVSNSASQIVAKLPTPPAGSLLLTVAVNGAVTTFEITEGSVGPPGPKGPSGPAGPAGPAGPQGLPGSALTFPYYGSVASFDTAFNIYNSAGGAILGWGDSGGYGVSGIGGTGASNGYGGAGLIGTGGSSTNGGAGVAAGGGNGSGSGYEEGAGGNGVSAFGGIGTSTWTVAGQGVYAVGGAGPYAGAGVYAVGGNSNGSTGDCGHNYDYPFCSGPGVLAFGGSSPAGSGVPNSPGGAFFGGLGQSPGGDGVDAYGGSGVPLYASCFGGRCDPGLAALLDGNVSVTGNLSKAGGSFQIDHPLDPSNKYLYHSFVESPDMMNVYNGEVVTDGAGLATVTMPDWFESLNRDFRYQLTVVGQFAQAMVASKIANNRFTIRTDKPHVEICWQVTGIRQDAWANAHRIPVEADKPQADQGHYLHPELFGHADEPAIANLHHPVPKQILRRLQQQPSQPQR